MQVTDEFIAGNLAELLQRLTGRPEAAEVPETSRQHRQLYERFRAAGATSGLLSLIGSWHDTLSDEEMLELVRLHVKHGQ